MTRPVAPKPWEEKYRHQGRLWGGDKLDTWTDTFLAAHPEALASTWLDVACGDGKGLRPLGARLDGGHVVGVDLARHGLGLVGEPSRLVQGDMVSLPFAARRFAHARAVHAVGHLLAEDRHRAWCEIHRVLAPTGIIIVTEFALGDMRARTGAEVEPGTRRRAPGTLTHYYARDELGRELERAGFQVHALEVATHPYRIRGEPLERSRVLAVAGLSALA